MSRILYAVAAAALATLTPAGATYADECVFEAEAPEIPDGSKATAEDVEAAKTAILAFQKALAPYRECLNAIVDNAELEKDVRKAALDKYNASVDSETALVEKWQAMMTAYKAKG